jgi:hypothetical protein
MFAIKANLIFKIIKLYEKMFKSFTKKIKVTQHVIFRNCLIFNKVIVFLDAFAN